MPAFTAIGRVSRWLSAALAVFAFPAAASAAVTLEEFTVTPAGTQAGSHPDVTIFQRVSLSSTSDDVDDTLVRLAPGLLGNPQSAALCTSEQLRSSAGCPAASQVGSVHVTATIHPAPPLLSIPDQGIDGTVYNLRPTGAEPARIGLKLQPFALPPPLPQALPPVYLESPVYLRPGPDGIGLESLFADQPREQDGLNVQITSVRLTFNGRASRGTFMRMPTSCVPATSTGSVTSYEAPGALSSKSSVFTPTGCDALGFSPTASGAVGAVGATKRGSFPPLSTTLTFDPEEAALKSAQVTLPTSLASNVTVLQRACQRAQADANACPESSRVGTAVIDSPLQAEPVSGPVYLAFNSSAALPGLIVLLPPPVGLRIDGFIDLAPNGLRNTFPSNPDLPLRSFKLEFDGGPQGALTLSRDLCDPATPVAIGVSLVAHSGKTRHFKRDLATPGCDPLTKVTLTKHRRTFTLAAVLKSPRGGPALKKAKVTLPKALKRGRFRPRVRIDGKKARAPRRAKRAIAPKLGRKGARRVKIVWSGLKRAKGKRLRQTVVVPVTIKDARGKTTRLRVRVQRG